MNESGLNFWQSGKAAASKPLTAEDFIRGMEAIKRRSDWLWANPHGSKENPHLVSPNAMKRGGYNRCIDCRQMIWTGEGD